MPMLMLMLMLMCISHKCHTTFKLLCELEFKERKANSAERPKSTELYRALRLRVNLELTIILTDG